jgi:site-specific DNA-methyltransferase (adenine-specific)
VLWKIKINKKDMNKIFNDNAISIIDRMIEKNYKIDLIVTDPPYKVTSRGGYTSAGGMMLDEKMRKGDVFKENQISVFDWLPKLYEILKDTGHCYIMCNNKNLYEFMSAVEKSGFHLVKTMVWGKDNKIMSQAYMSQTEFILFLRKGAFVKINNCGTSDLLQIPNKKTKNENGENIHPTEKPVELMKILIENSSKDNEIVFEPFMGVGSTCVATVLSNRQYIGVELDENYFKISEERIKKAWEEKRKEKDLTQKTLFGDGM